MVQWEAKRVMTGSKLKINLIWESFALTLHNMITFLRHWRVIWMAYSSLMGKLSTWIANATQGVLSAFAYNFKCAKCHYPNELQRIYAFYKYVESAYVSISRCLLVPSKWCTMNHYFIVMYSRKKERLNQGDR